MGLASQSLTFRLIATSIAIIAVRGSINQECRRSTLGFDYLGKRNTTNAGRTCQAWSSQVPHSHNNVDARRFPDDTLDDAANYCRNPDGDLGGLWCYTTDPNYRFEYCDVPACSEYPECRLTDAATEYRGHISKTRLGAACIPWSLVTDSFNANDANFCRNPDNRLSEPWCYTAIDGSREYCDVPFCKPSAYCKRTSSGEEYIGTVSITENGVPCQRWDSQLPHQHDFDSPADFPEGDITEASNYCRNPDGQASGPWCFTKDPDVRQERCDIPVCADCRISDNGVEYAGELSSTSTGRSCLRWSSLSGHAASIKDANRFPDATLNDASNYCRNPDRKSGGPWCYWGDDASSWEYCSIPSCTGSGEDTFKPRLTNHILHIGIDGLHPCFVDSSTGASNIMTRLAQEGVFTLTRGRTEMETVSAPSWTAILCSLPMETSGTTSNSWRPPWMGYGQPITPSMGPNVGFPCVWQQIKSQDASIRTASFTNWDWFKYITSFGLPTALDYDFFCNDYSTCDEQLVLAAAEYIEAAMNSAESTYTFVYIGNVDGTGHSKGWCGTEYMAAVDEADRLVGLLLDVVDRAEVGSADREPTKVTVMLSTDHGGHARTHGSYLDSDLIISAFIRGPLATGGAGGLEFRHEVSNVDYVPTAMEWLGLKPNPWWKGRVLEESFELIRK